MKNTDLRRDECGFEGMTTSERLKQLHRELFFRQVVATIIGIEGIALMVLVLRGCVPA